MSDQSWVLHHHFTDIVNEDFYSDLTVLDNLLTDVMKYDKQLFSTSLLYILKLVLIINNKC